jgi:hypothetical protein
MSGASWNGRAGRAVATSAFVCLSVSMLTVPHGAYAAPAGARDRSVEGGAPAALAARTLPPEFASPRSRLAPREKLHFWRLELGAGVATRAAGDAIEGASSGDAFSVGVLRDLSTPLQIGAHLGWSRFPGGLGDADNLGTGLSWQRHTIWDVTAELRAHTSDEGLWQLFAGAGVGLSHLDWLGTDGFVSVDPAPGYSGPWPPPGAPWTYSRWQGRGELSGGVGTRLRSDLRLLLRAAYGATFIAGKEAPRALALTAVLQIRT